eukprot:44423-Pyramimonas_sp.AAC.1
MSFARSLGPQREEPVRSPFPWPSRMVLRLPRGAPPAARGRCRGPRVGGQKERARAQRETRVAAAQRLTAERGPLGSLTVLEQIAIRPVTEALYKKTATAFLEFCTKRGLDRHNVEEMD